jgi:hypothetical protein
MSFFELPPPVEQPEPRPQPAWAGPPDDALGAPVAIGPIALVETDKLVIGVTNLIAYPAGVELDLVVLRPRGTDGDMIAPMSRHALSRHALRRELPEEFLRFGVEFADGRKATNVRMQLPPGGASTLRVSFTSSGDEPASPVLWQRGGGGNGTRYSQTFWLWPLPPPGLLAFVCEWPDEGVELSRAEINAAPILDAAGRALVFWKP